MKKGKVNINKDRCKGCGYCIDICPRKCIAFAAAINKRGVYPAEFVRHDQCIACTLCAQVCPDVCIEVFEL